MSSRIVISGSTGFIGNVRCRQLVEESSPPASGFLAEVAKRWEQTTKEVESMSLRHTIIRIGVMLEPGGGFQYARKTRYALHILGSYPLHHQSLGFLLFVEKEKRGEVLECWATQHKWFHPHHKWLAKR